MIADTLSTVVSAAGRAGQATVSVSIAAVILLIVWVVACEVAIAIEKAKWERDRDEDDAELVHALSRMDDRMDDIGEASDPEFIG